ncbi:hypothetical protein RIR_jg33038.t1 [Rhizophagus irregularis DAOM 181602=DAOM 197198]|nr:hypothetical protein RIR_jg33038.t1 [Rhizophagus irregularis DAOM 181602=DAOM 197198]
MESFALKLSKTLRLGICNISTTKKKETFKKYHDLLKRNLQLYIKLNKILPIYFPQVEEALLLWITNVLAAELTINTDILHEKAKYFAQ